MYKSCSLSTAHLDSLSNWAYWLTGASSGLLDLLAAYPGLIEARTHKTFVKLFGHTDPQKRSNLDFMARKKPQLWVWSFRDWNNWTSERPLAVWTIIGIFRPLKCSTFSFGGSEKNSRAFEAHRIWLLFQWS